MIPSSYGAITIWIPTLKKLYPRGYIRAVGGEHLSSDMDKSMRLCFTGDGDYPPLKLTFNGAER